MAQYKRATYNLAPELGLIATSLDRQSAYNTYKACGLGRRWPRDVLSMLPQPRMVLGEDEVDGTEMGSLYHYSDLGPVSLNLNLDRPEYQDFATCFGGILGLCPNAAQGGGLAGTNAYQHVFTKMVNRAIGTQANSLMPAMTLVMRPGYSTEPHYQFVDFVCNSVTLTIDREQQFVQLSSSWMSSGQYQTSLNHEIVTGLDNAGTITLAANHIQGATDLGHIFGIYADDDDDGRFEEPVEFSAVTAAAPSVITITTLGGAGVAIDYLVVYNKKFSTITPDLSTEVATASVLQPKLLTAQTYMTFNPTLSGTTLTLGKSYGEAIKRVQVTLSRANPNPAHNIGAVSNTKYANDQEIARLSITGNITFRAEDYKLIAQPIAQRNTVLPTSGVREFGSLSIVNTCDVYADYDEAVPANPYSAMLAIPKLIVMEPTAETGGINMAHTVGFVGLEHASLVPTAAVVDRQSSGYFDD